MSNIQKCEMQKSDIQKSNIQKSDIQKSNIQKSNIQTNEKPEKDRPTTGGLTEILSQMRPEDLGGYLKNNEAVMLGDGDGAGMAFLKEKLKEKKLQQKELFARAQIPERYGYKLLRGERKTKVRDVILRMCIAAGFTLKETQSMLSRCFLPALYPKTDRDAAIIIALNRRFGSIEKTNALLQEHGLETLQECGKA